MKQGQFAKTAIALVLAGACVSGYGLGLGEISVSSNLNQRFLGTIPLSEISAEDLESVTVTVAPPDAFSRAGVERADFLNGLRFQIKSTGGSPRVVVTSPDIIREPVVNLLLQARWKGGKIVREYTVLLDPPDLPLAAAPSAPTIVTKSSVRLINPDPAPAATSAVAPPAPAPALPAPSKPVEIIAVPPAAPLSAPRPVLAAPPPPRPEAEFFETPDERRSAKPVGSAGRVATPVPAATARFGETYGPIKPGETLWRVATNLRPGKSVSMEQMMLAIVEANRGTIDRGITLTEGSRLNVPSPVEVLAYSQSEAKARLAAIQQGRAPSSRTVPEPATSRPVLAPPAAVPAPAPTLPVKPVIAPPAAAPAPAPTLPVKPVIAPPAPAPVPAPTPSAPVEPAATPSAPTASVDGTAQAPVIEAPVAPPIDAAPVAEVPPAVTQPGLPIAPEVPEPSKPEENSPNLAAYWPLLAGGALVLGLGIFGLSRRRKGLVKGASVPPAKPAPSATAMKAATAVTVATVSPPPPTRAGDTLVRSARQLAEDDAPFNPAATAAGLLSISGLEGDAGASVMSERREGYEQVERKAPSPTKADANPLADADFHLAYGLHDEAIEVLTQAIAENPQRDDYRLKLAEVYFAAERKSEFESLARSLKGKLSSSDWAKLAIMGEQLMPKAVLFQSEDKAAAAMDFQLTIDRLPPGQTPLGLKSAMPATSAEPELPNLASDLADDLSDVPQSKPVAAVKAAAPARAALPPQEDPDSIDFMLGQSIVPLGMNLLAPKSAPMPMIKNLDASQEFNLGATSINIPSDGAPSELPSVESDYEISLQSLQVSLTPREVAPASEEELNTKLDLARAYVEMEDHESARGLLNEVLDQGSDQHKKEAESLMQRLPK